MGASRGVKGGAANVARRPKTPLTLARFSSGRISFHFGNERKGNRVRGQACQPKKCAVLPSPLSGGMPAIATVSLRVVVRAEGDVVVERFPDVLGF